MICECGHVGGKDVSPSKSKHLNGVEACLATDCDCESFDAASGPSLTIRDPKATAIVVAGQSLLDAANALRLAGLDRLADVACELQRQLNDELVQRIRDQKPSTESNTAPGAA